MNARPGLVTIAAAVFGAFCVQRWGLPGAVMFVGLCLLLAAHHVMGMLAVIASYCRPPVVVQSSAKSGGKKS
ncbi:MAG TPA: hypothetical protein VHD61_15595 [Lacunisphaera sp.]|nr:hypothetical protein [Lacunisphaera sp.]